MPDVQQLLVTRLQQAVTAAFGDACAQVDPQVRPSAQPQFGDYQANLAMSLSKQLGTKPRDVATKIVEALKQQNIDDVCTKVEIAGPGFINLHLTDAYLSEQLNAMAADGDRLGVAKAAKQKVVVDYSSPNVAKEMHVGHLRSTIIGDSIARVLAFQGHDVIRQNHLGDWGTQFGRVMLGLWYEAVATQQGKLDELNAWIQAATDIKKADNKTPEQKAAVTKAADALLDAIVPWHQAAIDEDPLGQEYFEPYLENAFPSLARLQELYTFASTVTDLPQAQRRMIRHKQRADERPLSALPSFFATFVQRQDLGENKQEAIAWKKSCAVTISACQSIYNRLDVQLTPEDVAGESKYNDKLKPVVDELRKLGVLKESDGAMVIYPEGFKDREGNPLPMIVQKGDGGFLYATTDLAAARYRINELHAQRIVYVTDSRQSQHFAMLFKALRMIGWAPDTIVLEHVPFGTVLGPDGKPLKTREGANVRLVDLIDQAEERALKIIEEKNPDLPATERTKIAHAVGIGALKYADLSSDRIKDYIFDFDRMLAFDGNTAPYIQNAFVRVHGIFRKGGIDPATLANKAIVIAEPAEHALALKLVQLPSVIDSVAQSLEPHRMCTYLYETAAAYHKFFETCPVLAAPDEAIRSSRLRLCALTAAVFKLGLGLLGIETIERM